MFDHMQNADDSDLAPWAVATSWFDENALSRFCERCGSERLDLDASPHETYAGAEKRILAFLWGEWLTFGDAEVFVTDEIMRALASNRPDPADDVVDAVLNKTASVSDVVLRQVAGARDLRASFLPILRQRKPGPAQEGNVLHVDTDGWVSSIRLNQ